MWIKKTLISISILFLFSCTHTPKIQQHLTPKCPINWVLVEKAYNDGIPIDPIRKVNVQDYVVLHGDCYFNEWWLLQDMK